jgi:hypothetical protein
LQRINGSVQAVLQHTLSAQERPDAHCEVVAQAPPWGTGVLVGVLVTVAVAVWVAVCVAVAVRVTVEVRVAVAVRVALAVIVAVAVCVAVLVLVAVAVIVAVAVTVGVLVGVLVGTHGQAGTLPHEPPVGAHAPVEHEPPVLKQMAHSLSVGRHRTLPPRKQWQQHAPSPPRAEPRVIAWSASDALSAMSTSVAYRPIRASHQPRHRIPTVDDAPGLATLVSRVPRRAQTGHGGELTPSLET